MNDPVYEYLFMHDLKLFSQLWGKASWSLLQKTKMMHCHAKSFPNFSVLVHHSDFILALCFFACNKNLHYSSMFGPR